MTVVELVAKLGLKVDEGDFQKGAAAIGGLKAGLAAIGLSVGAARVALEAIVNDTASAATGFEKAARRVGMARVQFQELSEAAQDSGLSAEGFENSMRFLNRGIATAADGSKEMRKDFRSLGVEVTKSTKAGDVFERLVESFSKMEEGPKKVALAMRIFGRAGADMLPFLDKGSAGLKESIASNYDLGKIFSDEDVKNAKEYKKATRDIRDAIEGLERTIGRGFMKQAAEGMKAIAGWIAANRKVIAAGVQRAIDLTTAAVKRMKQVLEPFVKILGAVATNTLLWKAALIALSIVAVAQFGNAIAGVVGKLGTMLTAIRSITAAQMMGAAASLATGLLWAAGLAIIMLAVEDIYTFLQDGDSVIGEWGMKFTKWLDDVLKINPDDSPLMKGLKHLLQVLTDIQGSAEKFDAWWKSGGDDGVASALKGVVAAINGETAIARYQMGQAFLTPQGREAAGVTTLAGSTAQPGAGGRVTVAPTLNVQVQAPPGTTDPAAWGEAIGNVVDERLRAVLDPAWSAAPLAGGGG